MADEIDCILTNKLERRSVQQTSLLYTCIEYSKFLYENRFPLQATPPLLTKSKHHEDSDIRCRFIYESIPCWCQDCAWTMAPIELSHYNSNFEDGCGYTSLSTYTQPILPPAAPLRVQQPASVAVAFTTSQPTTATQPQNNPAITSSEYGDRSTWGEIKCPRKVWRMSWQSGWL